MIKVLELIDGGFIGGGQINVLSVAGGIDKSVYDVCVAARGGEVFEQECKNRGIKFKPINMPKLFRQKYLKPLVEFVREEKFNIIHSHGGVAGFYGRLAKKHIPEVKVVHAIHGIHYLNTFNIIRNIVTKTIEQYLVQFTDMTICETESDLKTAIKIKITDPGKSIVINNGINLARFAKFPPHDEQLAASLGIKQGDFVIGNISRFDIQKNQRLIIKAASILTKKYPHLKFVLVGDGKLLDNAKLIAKQSQLENIVIFTGAQTELIKYYSLFDIFVFPTLWEGMPYVMIEALAAGCPLICSGIPNLREIINETESALFIDPRNVNSLVEAIEKLLGDEELRSRLSFNARKLSVNFEENTMVKKIENIYKAVLEEGNYDVAIS